MIVTTKKLAMAARTPRAARSMQGKRERKRVNLFRDLREKGKKINME